MGHESVIEIEKQFKEYNNEPFDKIKFVLFFKRCLFSYLEKISYHGFLYLDGFQEPALDIWKNYHCLLIYMRRASAGDADLGIEKFLLQGQRNRIYFGYKHPSLNTTVDNVLNCLKRHNSKSVT